MAEEEKKDLDIPVLSISKEELDENQRLMNEAKDVLTPPKGQVLVGLRSFCPIHGDITRASRIIKHTIYMKSEVDGKVHPISSSDCICLACVSDLWRSKVVANYPKDENGNPRTVQIAPVFVSEEEYNKLVEEQKKKAAANIEAAAPEDASKEEEAKE